MTPIEQHYTVDLPERIRVVLDRMEGDVPVRAFLARLGVPKDHDVLGDRTSHGPRSSQATIAAWWVDQHVTETRRAFRWAVAAGVAISTSCLLPVLVTTPMWLGVGLLILWLVGLARSMWLVFVPERRRWRVLRETEAKQQARDNDPWRGE